MRYQYNVFGGLGRVFFLVKDNWWDAAFYSGVSCLSVLNAKTVKVKHLLSRHLVVYSLFFTFLSNYILDIRKIILVFNFIKCIM